MGWFAARLQILTLALVACAADRPDRGAAVRSSEGAVAAVPSADSIARLPPGADSGGIPFGPYHLPEARFGSPFTAVLRNGNDPAEVLAILAAARQHGTKVVLNMFVSRKHIQSSDGSFSLERWKQRIDRFRGIGLESYIEDGTLIGNYLMDEPHSRNKWDGDPVPFADIDAAAQYSKEIWPALPTLVRSHPAFLKGADFRYRYLDAAWAQYSKRKGPVRRYARNNAAQARQLGLGLVVGLNVLDGGDGSDEMAGTREGASVMWAAELRRYGSVLAAEPYACGFFMWKFDKDDSAYFDRPDVKAALQEVARVAADRRATSCRAR